MGLLLLKEGERRRSPRYECGGRASIYSLPFDGSSISGTLRNLSLGGICLDIGDLLDVGTKIEVLISVNSSKFRAAAMVSGRRDRAGTSLKFLDISAGAKDVLAEAHKRLGELQALNRRLRTAREEEVRRVLMKRPGLLSLGGREDLGFITLNQSPDGRTFVVEKTDKTEEPMISSASSADEPPPLIEIDLFG